MKNIVIKEASENIISEMKSVGFDDSFINSACKKYTGRAYKIFSLKPYEANILKQTALSLGFDCAVNRDTVMCKCDYTDCIIFGSISQYEKLIQKLENQPFRLKLLAKEFFKKISSHLLPLTIKNTVFDWTRPYIMGVLNVTPNSFSDGGKYLNPYDALTQVQKMVNDGADIIDIGGESTKPNAETVSVQEEIDRVIPVIGKIRQEGIGIPISIDTRNYLTAKEALKYGADIINDVSGLDYDGKLFDYVLNNNIPVIVMHSDKVPAVSSDFSQSDITEEVYFSLNGKINLLLSKGMEKNKIIADIGIGFGKSFESNFELLKRINEFSSLNVPVLSGISRKSFIRKTFDIDFDESDIVTALYSSMLKNVNIHRVHNVKLTKKYIDYVSKIV